MRTCPSGPRSDTRGWGSPPAGAIHAQLTVRGRGELIPVYLTLAQRAADLRIQIAQRLGGGAGLIGPGRDDRCDDRQRFPVFPTMNGALSEAPSPASGRPGRSAGRGTPVRTPAALPGRPAG